MALNIEHPRKIVVPVAVGLAWGNDGTMFQEKLDGQFSTLAVETHVLAGETMDGGPFIAWDCVMMDGQDIRLQPAIARFDAMQAVCRSIGVPWVQSSPNGGELLQRVLAAGGEGIVRKTPDSNYYATMTACKRVGTWHCRVTDLDLARGSATIADAVTGEARGNVAMREKSLQCKIGSILKVEGLELTKAGKIRDPRPCKDTETSWLLKF